MGKRLQFLVDVALDANSIGPADETIGDLIHPYYVNLVLYWISSNYMILRCGRKDARLQEITSEEGVLK